MKKFAVNAIATLTLTLIASNAMALTRCSYGDSDQDSFRIGHGKTQAEAMVNLYSDCYREFSRGALPVRVAGKAWCNARIQLATCASIKD